MHYIAMFLFLFTKRCVTWLIIFNIDLINLFYECEESNIASYADDITPYSCARDTQTVISELKSLTNYFTDSSIITLKSVPENVIYFWVPKPRLTYLLVMLHLKLAQKKPYLESWLTQNSILTNMFLPFVVKLARNYMFLDGLLPLCLLKNVEH